MHVRPPPDPVPHATATARALIFIFNIWTILLAGFGCSIVYIFNLPSVQWK